MKLSWWQRWFPFLRRKQCEARYVIDGMAMAELHFKVISGWPTRADCEIIANLIASVVNHGIVECREMSDHELMTLIKSPHEAGYRLRQEGE